MSVITALTVQNTEGVIGIAEVRPETVAEQIDAVIRDIPPAAVKTGMLLNSPTVEVVVSKIRQYGLSNLIVDPVLTSTSGSALLSAEARRLLCRDLLPLALVVTPNIDEAQSFTGRDLRTVDDMEEAALQIHGFGVKNVYVKGGHLEGPSVDVFFDGSEFIRLDQERIPMTDAHGTGCVLSAAMAAYLAKGETLPNTIRFAKEFVTTAIRNGLRLGKGRGPCDPLGIVR